MRTLAGCRKTPVGRVASATAPDARRRDAVDVPAHRLGATTQQAGPCRGNPSGRKGLGAICFVAARPRWHRIALLAAPRIWHPKPLARGPREFLSRLLTVTILALFLVAATAAAAEPIAIGERVTIQSQILGEERTILISTPANYARSTERYPVLYMTDGDTHLTHTRGTVDFLAANGLMPDLIIVGVANTDRARDLSPTHWVRPALPGEPQGPNTSGGADKFLDFFAKELFPYVESHYRTLSYRVFAGHSLGGLLALHIMVARPDMFNAYIAASPALTWDDDYPLRTTKAFFKDRKVFPKTLFVAMGNEEAGHPKPTRFDWLRDTLGRVKAEGFVRGFMLMEDESHGSMVLRTHYWGLRKIFDGWRLPVDPKTGRFTGTLADVKSHYAALGKRLGIPLLPPEPTVNLLGYEFLQGGSSEQAISIFRYNAELYPDSANVYDSLGEALENAGCMEEAFSSYGKAVENAQKAKDKQLDVFTRNRDRAAAAVKNTKRAP